ncbi:unnamed protein product, partial [Allacma fusca]
MLDRYVIYRIVVCCLEIKATVLYPATEEDIEQYVFLLYHLIDETAEESDRNNGFPDQKQSTERIEEESTPYLLALLGITYTVCYILLTRLASKQERDPSLFGKQLFQYSFFATARFKKEIDYFGNYLVAIVKARDITSIRDLIQDRLPLLESRNENKRRQVRIEEATTSYLLALPAVLLLQSPYSFDGFRVHLLV